MLEATDVAPSSRSRHFAGGLSSREGRLALLGPRGFLSSTGYHRVNGYSPRNPYHPLQGQRHYRGLRGGNEKAQTGRSAGRPVRPRYPIRGRRYRGSTQEIRAVRASKIAGLKLEGTGPLPSKAVSLDKLSERFLTWLTDARLESKTKTYYRNGWRMLKPTAVANMRVDEITGDWTDRLKFPPRLGWKP